MKGLLICALLSLPAAGYAQEDIPDLPGLKGAKEEASAEPVQRPDAQKIMFELSSALRLSAKQEQRISAAVKKQTAEFEKLMKEYEKNSAEERKWRFKMNENRYNMLRVNRGLPDTIREFLDDEQREAYDSMLEEKKKAAAEAAGAESPKPAQKRKLVKRRKAPAPGPEAAVEEEAGVMVDKEPAAARKTVKKKVVKKKPAPKPEPAPEEPAEEPAADPAFDEDAGSYP